MATSSRNYYRSLALAATVLVALTCIVAGGDDGTKVAEAVAPTEAPAVANATNVTSKPLPKNMEELKAALTEAAAELEPGLALAYFMLILFASVPIYFGSFASIGVGDGEGGEDVEIMTSEDAAYFPIYASCALFSMFLLFKFVGPEYVNLVLGAYFFALGTMSLTSALRPVGLLIVPADYLGEPYHFELTQKAPAAAEGDGAEKKGDAEAEAPKDILHFELSFDNADLACLFMSACVGVWYLCTKHWVATNLYGLSFALNGITLFVLPSFKIGSMLLCGLFFYDIFWVFCTPVMVTVARSFDAPIKVIFPKDFMENGFAAKQHAMLGLGDIVLPGVLVALLCRYDHNSGRKMYPYFWSVYIAYILGLVLTIVIMHTFKAAQPALLYLVPAVLLTPMAVAVVRGELKELFEYTEEKEEEAEEKVEKKDN